MRIRLAGGDDLDRVVAIYNAAIPGRDATADLVAVSPAQRRAWFHQRDPARRPLWVLEQEGEVRGWLALDDFSSRAGYHPTAEVAVYVAPQHQRCGHGRTLLEHALTTCPSLGIDRVVAKVFAHNASSVALFRRAGFAEWGLLPGVTIMDGVRRDVLMLGLALT
jgi:phosphinothricin acetyltransferase